MTVQLTRSLFFNTLAESLQQRMGCLPGKLHDRDKYHQFLANIKTLQPSNWPEECGVRYAETEVLELCTFFKLVSREAQRGMREYIDTVKATGEKSKPPKELKPLLRAVNTLVVSTTECERGFSQMNIISGMRATLELKSLSVLLFIKCVGPPVKCFAPRHYVKSWLQTNHVLASNLQARACERKQLKHNYEPIWSLL